MFHNGTNQVGHVSIITLQPGQLAFHPGPQDQYSIIQSTSPTARIFTLNSAFIGVDSATTDAHVLLAGASPFSGEISGYGNGPTFSTTLTLKAGDTVDFAVGYCNNGTYFNDSTGISATLVSTASVPEPTAIVLLGPGSAGTSIITRRRRRSIATGP